LASSEKPIFIVGVHRSGTTLLRYMLNSHPRIYIPPESDFIPRFFRRNPQQILSVGEVSRILDIIFNQYRFVREWQGPALHVSDFPKGNLTPAKFLDTLYCTYAQQNDASRWGDKTPIYSSYVDMLAQLFTQAQFIHLIRDGRDVALSMLDKWGQQDFHIDIYFAARNWVRRTRKAQMDGKHLGSERYYEIQYEDLVADPKYELGKICDFLNETYLPEMAQPQKLARKTIEPGSFHDPLREPPSIQRVARWRSEMQSEDLYLVQRVAGSLLQQLGYPLVEQIQPSFTEYIRQVVLAGKYQILQAGRNGMTFLGLKPPI
jgi:hypothetical protein